LQIPDNPAVTESLRIGAMRPGTVAPVVITVMACYGVPAVAQRPTAPLPMIGGGEVTLRQDGDDLRVTVTGPRAGLASVCVGDESRVRILHASAAIGEAAYERSLPDTAQCRPAGWHRIK
jgi:hypothetical protein